ncbi:fungal-specific transcription factor domain-containing protein [Trichoderma novae-zelandiae]
MSSQPPSHTASPAKCPVAKFRCHEAFAFFHIAYTNKQHSAGIGASTEIKCSGQVPCTNCQRRQAVCTFAPVSRGNSQIILLERGKQKTPATFESSNSTKRKQASSTRGVSAVSPPSRLMDDRLSFLYYFDVFAGRNNFTGKKTSLVEHVKQLSGLHSCSYLTDAMLSLGAIQAVKLNAPDAPPRSECLATALEYYSKSIMGLRDSINNTRRGDDSLHDTVLWATLFLGLFELINDETGDGWQQHMTHGTAKALEASGPSNCRAGSSRGFFVQARIFEVSRSILGNESTFLTQPGWMELSREMWTGEHGDEWHPLDSLLDIMVMVSRLRVRTAAFIDIQDEFPHDEPTPEAQSICSDALTLREALAGWYASYAQTAAESDTSLPEAEDASMLLSRIFFAAISIYLSGIFDYEVLHWHRLGLIPPTLNQQTIQTHTNTILGLSNLALDTTNLSPLLFLFPLRIAGARSRTQWQRDWVAKLIGRIGSGFAVARAISAELNHVWQIYELEDTPDEDGLNMSGEGL